MALDLVYSKKSAENKIISSYHLLTPNRQEQLHQIRQMNALLTDLLPIADQLRSVWRVSDTSGHSLIFDHPAALRD